MNITRSIARKVLVMQSLDAVDYGDEYVIKRGVGELERDVTTYLSEIPELINRTIQVHPRFPNIDYQGDHVFVMGLFPGIGMNYFYEDGLLQTFEDEYDAIPFLMRCFEDIKMVLDHLWEFQGRHMIHYDLKSKNILVSTQTGEELQCALHDYELLESMNVDDKKPYHFLWPYQDLSPFGDKYLRNKTLRDEFLKKGDLKTNLLEHQRIGREGKIYTLREIVLGGFFRFQPAKWSKIQADLYAHPNPGPKWTQKWCGFRNRTKVLVDVLIDENEKETGKVEDGFLKLAQHHLTQMEQDMEQNDMPIKDC